MVLQYANATINLKLAHTRGSWSLGPSIWQDLYSNPANCHQANPLFGAKTSILVAIMEKTTCVYGCTLYKYDYKVEIGSWARFMKLETWLTVRFIVQSAISHQANPCFGGKPTSIVAVLVQNTCVYDCRLVLHYLNFTILSLSGFMKPGVGIIDGFLLTAHHFLSNQSRLWRHID